MKIRLGYACLNKTLDLSFNNMTFSNYKNNKKIREKLDKIIKNNFETLKNILIFNIRNDIDFYRMTSNLIPLGTHQSVHFEVFKKYKKEWEEIGEIINKNKLRVDIHIEPYVVLNSINDNVVLSSINILNFYQKMFKIMKIKSYLVLHIGSSAGGKKESIKRFIENFNLLNNDLKKMIILENDDKTFNIKDTLNICKKLDIPFVLDYHHYICNHGREKLNDYIEDIFLTWKNEIPKIHFSSPKSKKEKRSHHDYIDCDSFISFINNIKINKDFDIMIEAKQKDEALFRLIRQLKYKNIYKIKKNAIFLKEKKGN